MRLRGIVSSIPEFPFDWLVWDAAFAFDARWCEQYLPELDRACPESSGTAPEIVAPHAVEFSVVVLFNLWPFAGYVAFPGFECQGVVVTERVPVFEYETSFKSA